MVDVSDDFLYVWKYISIEDLKEEIDKLEELEKILLGLLVCDRYKNPNDMVFKNLEHIEDIISLIEDFSNSDFETNDDMIKDLQKKTKCNYVDTNCLVDKRGFSITDPPNEEEIFRLKRESKINSILKNA